MKTHIPRALGNPSAKGIRSSPAELHRAQDPGQEVHQDPVQEAGMRTNLTRRSRLVKGIRSSEEEKVQVTLDAAKVTAVRVLQEVPEDQVDREDCPEETRALEVAED